MPPSPANPIGLRFNAGDDADAPRLSMAPLVDIVLLLICFYLLVSRAVQTHEDPEVLLPHMAEQRTLDEAPAEIVINLRADDAIIVNQQPISLEELGPLLAAQQERNRAAGRSLAVTIRADARQQYGRLSAILRVCRETGLGSVTLRASEGLSP